jgi:hypothetical protein
VTLGLNFNLISGRPIEVLGRHPTYGTNETFVLPRGSGGRTPFVSSFDFHVAWQMKIPNGKLDVYCDIFNMFNQQAPTDVDDQYTFDPVAPIPNGTLADLKRLRTVTGGQPTLNPNYGNATRYQDPLSMRFGIRASF